MSDHPIIVDIKHSIDDLDLVDEDKREAAAENIVCQVETLISRVAEISRLATTIAAKEAECDALQKEVEKWTADFRYQFDRADAAGQRLEAAEQALKLLAQSANSIALEFVGRLPSKHSIWGDLKNARRALASEDSAE